MRGLLRKIATPLATTGLMRRSANIFDQHITGGGRLSPLMRAQLHSEPSLLCFTYNYLHLAPTTTAFVARRLYSSRSKLSMSIKDTPLGKSDCQHLLNGLDIYTIPADGDSHPLTLYGINSTDPETSLDKKPLKKQPLLLLHGRTWSSVPVYHLLGGGTSDEQKKNSRSTMEELLQAGGIQPYALDFRGFGGTPSDKSGGVLPHRCVTDVETALKWIAERHQINLDDDNTDNKQKDQLPALLGWSQGALVAQLVAQKSSCLMSKLILYGSIYDSMHRYPRDPLYTITQANTTIIENQYDWAIEDFTIEDSIPHFPADSFAKACLLSDPYKAQWQQLHEFNDLDPACVNIDTLVVSGDQDPYTPRSALEELFVNLGRGYDKQWNMIANADHALHLLDERKRFIHIIKSFIGKD
mmetsp:Transcript_61099/g.71476  ORF Transcript_61099/g.71476 Transcript_61099/m.71476 type:complete len:412 (-) Transcript_61099:319-1554(-)|eukprot:CAMPEP_0194370414 /NCGR_PEP_ID=MMETSP0174-20130528/18704_1 /TAXON_ID=216777 /ORGANISM="Proboscia alata, Strain PI-D3" /LENGTH=411 /DNA_ID=CAMNT_0039147865 /DNA_START=152 /DNA_END=1387 /DNA_ORIENTATION=-